MSWSYSGDPTVSTRDELRFLIQDTDEDDQQLSNEEVDYLLTQSSDVPETAAIAAVEALVAKYTRKADKSLGDLSISYSQIASSYRSMLVDLRRRAAVATLSPYAGGIRISDKQIDEEDSDMVQPSFRKGQMDYDGTQTEDEDERT